MNTKLITYLKIMINFILFIAAVLLLILVLPKILKFFLPFVIGWIVSLMANPMVHFLEKKVKLLRKHSTAIIIVLAIAFIVGVAALFIAILVKEAKELSEDLPALIEGAKEQLSKAELYMKKLTSPFPESIHTSIDNLIAGVENSITDYMKNKKTISVSSAGNFVGNVAEGFLMVIVTILSAYFFTAGRNELIAGMKKTLPESMVNYWRLIYDNFTAAFGGYFKAQFKIMFVLTAIMFLGFELLGVGYSFLIALGIAFLDVLPVFGTGAVLWPWAVVNMISGKYISAIGLVVIYFICQVVKQILQPKMVGDSIGLHPLTTLLFLFIGYKIYGVFGMIIGIPIGMVLVNMYRIGVFDRIIKGFKIVAKDLNDFRKF